MVAAEYARLRSSLALQSGLGLKPEDRPSKRRTSTKRQPVGSLSSSLTSDGNERNVLAIARPADTSCSTALFVLAVTTR